MSLEEIPVSEPTEITIGETLAWKRSLEDFPARSGCLLSYAFRGAGRGFDVTATADGDDFLVNVAESVTAQMAVGTYYWEAWINDGSEDYMIAEGETQVIKNLKSLSVTTVVDNRSDAKKTLDAIDARIQGRVAADVQSYQIGTRQLMKIPMRELMDLHTYYARLVAKERRRARRRPLISNINVRFD